MTESHVLPKGCDVYRYFIHDPLVYMNPRTYAVVHCEEEHDVPETGTVVFDNQWNQRNYRLPNRFVVVNNHISEDSVQCCAHMECLNDCTSLYLYNPSVYGLHLEHHNITNSIFNQGWCDTVNCLSSLIYLDFPYQIQSINIMLDVIA